MGMHVPDAMGNRVYKMFASPTAKQQEGADSANLRFSAATIDSS